MKGVLIIVGVTVIFGLILWFFDGRKRKKAKEENPQADDEVKIESEKEENTTSSECCGMHVVCEKDSLSPISDEIEYYEDEELDRFSSRTAEDYTESEIEEWRDVLLTLRPEEIAGWARSVQLRGLEMPAVVRDELLMIVSEARASLSNK